jgi:spore coat polysaccharide biosynthesis protein SpsF
MKIIAFLQARMGSARLPGKVLKPLLGAPMLIRQIERVRRSCLIEKLVVVTSVDASDAALADVLSQAGVVIFRGSLDDVLDRFYQAAKPYQPEHVVRLTGDCPLTDPTLIDEAINAHLCSEADYTSTALNPTYPDGLDVEVIRFSALERAWRETDSPSTREHVTPYIYHHPELFRLKSVEQLENMSDLRWTVDEPADFVFVERVYGELYPVNPFFAMSDVLVLLEKRPELLKINTQFKRNEGYAKSIIRQHKISLV